MNLLSVPRENFTAGGLLTPSAVTEVMPKDSQPSLDLASATSGDKIVTAQVLGNGFKSENHSNVFCHSIVRDFCIFCLQNFRKMEKQLMAKQQMKYLDHKDPDQILEESSRMRY